MIEREEDELSKYKNVSGGRIPRQVRGKEKRNHHHPSFNPSDMHFNDPFLERVSLNSVHWLVIFPSRNLLFHLIALYMTI